MEQQRILNLLKGECAQYTKKGDPREISNYRPITVLNTDYKIFTKALTNKLTPIASSIIKEEQAGFLPNRSIFDQIKLTKLLISYAEQEKKNGAIVALDQEKAYDKITHDYLWKTLKRMKIPAHFINIIKNLYKNAKTRIIINGIASSSYNITRGVRQGDPLSCILFNLAIEPLAEMLRKSAIQGYNIPKCSKKIITTLFADDTTVYLSSEDSFSNLQQYFQNGATHQGPNLT